MDPATYIQNAVKAQRAEAFAKSDQLTLGEIISKCEAIQARGYARHDGSPPRVEFDFCHAAPTGFDSWRGIYAELAIGFTFDQDCLLPDFLKMARTAVGATFHGYKGGDYTMSRHTPVWVANYGISGDTAVLDVVDNGYRVLLITGVREP